MIHLPPPATGLRVAEWVNLESEPTDPIACVIEADGNWLRVLALIHDDGRTHPESLILAGHIAADPSILDMPQQGVEDLRREPLLPHLFPSKGGKPA